YLENFRQGIERTFVYELVDEKDDATSVENNWGLLTHRFRPKPAYAALRDMIRLLSDPGSDFVPGRLDFSLHGTDLDTRSVLLQRHDGQFFLALWQQVEPGSDDGCERRSGEHTITVRIGQPVSAVALYRPSCGADPVERPAAAGTIRVPVG